jgi:hypothetical protein
VPDMRCEDLAGTWRGLRGWLAAADVLVLPRLEYAGPSARLDAEVDPTRPASRAEVEATVATLRDLVRRFDVRAVYVGYAGDPTDAPAAVTLRVMAGGVVHELTLVAAGYAVLDDDEAATGIR